jgi:hypothetical protein
VAQIILGMSMSIDGFIAGPADDVSRCSTSTWRPGRSSAAGRAADQVQIPQPTWTTAARRATRALAGGGRLRRIPAFSFGVSGNHVTIAE